MNLIDALNQPITQAVFAELVGVSEARVSQLMASGAIRQGETAGQWLLSYTERLRDQAAGRMGENGGLDLVQERAALARSQRFAQDMKNSVALGEYAPVGLLSDVLGKASSSVVDRFDQLPGKLAKACPDLPEAARSAVLEVVTSARNQWVRSTATLVDAFLDELPEDDDGGSVEAELV